MKSGPLAAAGCCSVTCPHIVLERSIHHPCFWSWTIGCPAVENSWAWTKRKDPARSYILEHISMHMKDQTQVALLALRLAT